MILARKMFVDNVTHAFAWDSMTWLCFEPENQQHSMESTTLEHNSR